MFIRLGARPGIFPWNCSNGPRRTLLAVWNSIRLPTVLVARINAWFNLANRTHRSSDCTGRPRINRSGASRCWKLGTRFASIQNSRTTQFIVKWNSRTSFRGSCRTLGLFNWSNSGGSCDCNPWSVASIGRIILRVRRSDGQIGAQRFGGDNSPRECLVHRSQPCGVRAEVCCRQRCNRAEIRWIYSPKISELIGTHRTRSRASLTARLWVPVSIGLVAT